MEMIIISGAFAAQNNGVQDIDSPNVFFSIELNSGEWACDKNSVDEFPQLFEGVEYTIREVSESDVKPVVIQR